MASPARGLVPPAAPTGFPAVPSPMTAQMLRSTMAIGLQAPAVSARPLAPDASPPRVPAEPLRSTAAFDPFAWNLDPTPAVVAAPPRSGVLDVRALKQTALGVSAPPLPSPPVRAPVAAVAIGLAAASIRKTALGVAPLPETPSVPLEFHVADDLAEADAFPLIRSTQPSGTTVTTRPPPPVDHAASLQEDIEIPSGPAPAFDLDAESTDLEASPGRPSPLPTYAPFRAPPSRRPGPLKPVGWWWSAGGAALVFSAGVALRSAPLSVALRAAAAAASLLMLARFGGLSMRALLLLLVALPALAQESLSVASLSRIGAAVLTGALVLLPTGAWISADRMILRRVFLAVGIALTAASVLIPGGVVRPWSLGAAPAVLLGLAALITPARWVSVALTATLMAWAAACGVSGGGAMVPGAATGVAMAALVLVCGRSLAAVAEGDNG